MDKHPAPPRSREITIADDARCVPAPFPIVPYFPPFEDDVDVNHWIDVLDELASLHPATVVPGHGEVSDTYSIVEVREFFNFVREMAGRVRANGAYVDDAAASIEAAARARWTSWDSPLSGGYVGRAFSDV